MKKFNKKNFPLPFNRNMKANEEGHLPHSIRDMHRTFMRSHDIERIAELEAVAFQMMKKAKKFRVRGLKGRNN